MNEPNVITQEGYNKLLAEKQELEKEKRPYAVERLKKAREMGDLKENGEYSAAREELNFIDERIDQLEDLLKNAKIVSHAENHATVQIGDIVKVEANGEVEEFTIVGQAEANIEEKKLSHKSPLGQALLGNKKNDIVQINSPSGRLEYKIVDIK